LVQQAQQALDCKDQLAHKALKEQLVRKALPAHKVLLGPRGLDYRERLDQQARKEFKGLLEMELAYQVLQVQRARKAQQVQPERKEFKELQVRPDLSE